MKLNMVKSILLGAKWIAWPDALWPALSAAGQGIQLPFMRIYWVPTLIPAVPLDIDTWLT